MTNVFEIAERRIDRLKSGGPIDPTGGGGDNGDMETRVTALEEAVKSLPTKADFAELRAGLKTEFAGMRADVAEGRADMQKIIIESQRWTHGALVAGFSLFAVGLLGLLFTIWNTNKPSAQPQAAPQQAPIIINVPGPAPAQAPAK